MNTDILNHFDIFAVGVSIAGIGILGFVTFFNNRKSETNRAFLMISLMTIFWSFFNLMIFQLRSSYLVLWSLRTAVFFAVWFAYYVFHLAYVVPQQRVVFPRWYVCVLLPIVFVAAFINLTPFVFSSAMFSLDDVPQVTNGPAIFLFGVVVLSLNAGGIGILFKKTRRMSSAARGQLRFILAGLLLTLSLIVVFNFIFPAFLSNPRFIPMAGVFIFPFIACTAYAIIRKKFLDIKVVSTEILVFVLAVALLFEVIASEGAIAIMYKSSVFLLVLGVGLLLIKSVRKEVAERDQIAHLAESLEKANMRLQELDKQKTEFLSIASHQLRTPLSIIKGYIELIHDGAYGTPSPKLLDALGDMDESNERLVKLVDEFLDISRIEQGRTKFNFGQYAIGALVDSVVKEISGRAKDKGLAIQWKGARVGDIRMDDEKIRHVVFNFVDNAIKYSSKGIISIAVNKEKDGVAVRVKDQGIGFDKKDEVNFFQKFYRGENIKSVDVGGTGLGLFVCRKFIEAHRGTVWAKSDGVGKGGEFGFWIPRE